MRIIHTSAAIVLLLFSACGRDAAPKGATWATTATAPATAPKLTFVGSIKSNIFHRPTCRSAKRIDADNLLVFPSREQAIKVGYRPCEVCRP